MASSISAPPQELATHSPLKMQRLATTFTLVYNCRGVQSGAGGAQLGDVLSPAVQGQRQPSFPPNKPEGKGGGLDATRMQQSRGGCFPENLC